LVLAIEALGEIVILAVACVASVTVRLLTVMPAPKLAVDVPGTKCVYWPTKATLVIVCPCCPLLGVTDVTTGVPAVTEKPLVRVATSPPVVTVTSRLPVVALGEIVILAVACVASVTVRLLTVMPAPKLAVDVPCTKCVYWPTKATLAIVCPCCPLFGVTDVSTGVGAVFVSMKFTSSGPGAFAVTL
jgi:hypothetical protein